LAHYTRCLKLAEQYNGQYEILFLHSNEYGHLVSAAGYETFESLTFNAKEVIEKAKSFDFSWLNYKDIKKIAINQAQVIKLLQPDLVLSDTMPTLKIASEISKVPCHVLMNAYMSKYYDKKRQLSRTHGAYWFLQLFPSHVSSQVTSFFETISMHLVHKPFKKLRDEFDLKYVNNLLSEIEGDQNLICDDPNIFPVNKLPQNYKLLGPILGNSSDCEQQLIKSLNPQIKTITICMGSSGNWDQMKILNDLPKAKYNIIACGSGSDLLNAKHIYSRSWVNLDKILPVTDLFICHAGNGTVYKGIEHRCIMLFSTHHFEQEWNAHRFEATGFGIDISEYKPIEVLNKIESVLEKEQERIPTLEHNFDIDNALWI